MTTIPVESSLTSTQYPRIRRGIDTGANLLFLSGSLIFILVFWMKSLEQRRLSWSSNKLAVLVAVLLTIACLSGASSLQSFLVNGLPWIMASIITKFFIVRSSLILLCCWGTFQLFSSAIAPVLDPSEALWWLSLLASLALVIFSAIQLRQGHSSQQSSVENSAKEPLLETGREHAKDKDSLLDQAGSLRLALFTWLDPLLAMGHKHLLQKSDVPFLANQDRVKTVSAEFFQALELEKLQHRSPPSIFGILVACHYKMALITGLFAFTKTVIISLNPLLLQLFIDFSAGKGHFPQEGYVLVAVLLLSKLVENLSQRHWSFGARRLGLRVRSSLIAAIYEKELKLSHDARQRHSAGEITSYISVDTFRLGEFPWWLHQSWTYPLQILIALCILLHTVGWATLPGLVIIVVTAAIQTPVAKAQQRHQHSLMLAQDERLRTTSAILGNMKIIKLQAWEKVFKDLIWSSRSVEFKSLSAVKNILAYGSLTFWMSPIITASIVFAACIPLGVELNATVIFTVLATFRVMQEPVRNVPEVLTAVIQAGVSMGRLSRFFNDNELQVGAVDLKPLSGKSEELAVHMNDAAFGWDSSGRAALSNISLNIRQHDVVAVCGMVGSGKSTLLHSVLGETWKLKGAVEVRGSIAYVAQTAWIQSGTVRDNVLFGQTYEESRYLETLLACSLVEDLSSFGQGDLTEIGERGLNLSGGQKQRIQLARALYSNADIYLLDDPFSAVDAQTASSLFKAYILKALSEKTVILVTHQVEFLSAVDKILVMNGGQILQAGSYQELLHPGSMFEKLVNAHQDAGGQKHYKRNSGEHMTRGSSFSCNEAPTAGRQGCGQLTQEEEREAGDLGLKPYKDYVKISRTGHIAALAVLAQGLFVFGTSWSGYWLASQVSNPATSDIKLVGVYAAISFLSAVFVQTRARSMMVLGLRACQAYFSGLLESLFQAPMLVFDSTPLGRILSRLSSDMNLLDVDIPQCMTFVLAGMLDLIGFIVILSIVTWQILLVALPMLLVLWFLQRYYLETARELIRINGTTKAPLLNKTAETVNGAVTIRAFKKEEQFKNENMELIDSDGAISIHTYAAYEWLAMRIEVLGAMLISSTALFMVLFKDAVPPGFAGLSLSYALGFSGLQVFLVQWSSNLASYIISVERIAQYMALPQEAPQVIKSNRPPATWPSKGRVELLNLQIRYRENSPLVLKGISCTFPEGKRIGLVGRTGSGKTTLISALFRLIEPAGGSIVIDGIDISKIGLHDLRSKLGVIPQEAFLFRGTIRFNLDPSEQCSDNELWQALRRCQLSREIEGSPDGLNSLVTDEGENWSAGQRQLFCLARVLLKRSKVLVLDEATASIDSTTDAILQRVIREEFAGCTVITVAHRIPTVIDSDMVLSLSDGYLVEYDSPKALLTMKDSLFAKLVNEYWASCKT